MRIDLLHARGNAADRLDRARRHRLHRGNLPVDFFGRLRGLHRERFDFRGHHGKSTSGFAGASGFDRGIEREQIGLTRDVLDELDHVADLLRRACKRADLRVGRAGFVEGKPDKAVGLAQLAADLGDR